ncbi:ribonuclease P protein component [Tistrella bauzanensis]
MGDSRGRGSGPPWTAPESQAHGARRVAVRVGFTASRKVGNSVARNRARRRLRAAAEACLPDAPRGTTMC